MIGLKAGRSRTGHAASGFRNIGIRDSLNFADFTNR
jgi:hypothetical protein